MAALVEEHDPHDLLKQIIESDFVDFSNKTRNTSPEKVIDLLINSKIYHLYQQVIPEPLIINVPNHYKRLIFNAMLWYFALQLGIARNHIVFTIKGGFTTQLMINSKYETEDIDVKVADVIITDELYQLMNKMIPTHIPFGFLCSVRDNRTSNENRKYKFSLQTENSHYLPFMDIESSLSTNNLSNVELHKRYAQINENNFEFSFQVYSLESQIFEKSELIKKYTNLLNARINSNIIPIFTQNIDIHLIPKYLNELYLLSKKNTYMKDDSLKLKQIIENETTKLLGITLSENQIEQLSNELFVKYEVNGEELSLFFILFLLAKFNKSYSKISTKNSNNRWKTRKLQENLVQEQKENEKLKRKKENELRQLQKRRNNASQRSIYEQQVALKKKENALAEQKRLRNEAQQKRLEKQKRLAEQHEAIKQKKIQESEAAKRANEIKQQQRLAQSSANRAAALKSKENKTPHKKLFNSKTAKNKPVKNNSNKLSLPPPVKNNSNKLSPSPLSKPSFFSVVKDFFNTMKPEPSN
jgi:hypothetical protein